MHKRTLVVLTLVGCTARALAQDQAAPAPQPATESTASPQPGAAPPPPATGELLDTVEVTATRRVEKMQNVPVAVTAMNQDQLQSRGIERLDDLNSLAPGLQISRSPSNTTISQIAIRGSSQYNPAIYWDPAVGIYVDGVYFGKAQGSIFDIVDLANVEVLRGPQGTLYGRNTIAGTINFVTREPSGQFSGHGDIEYGNYHARVGKLSVDLPRLLDFADITLGGRSERRDGWIETTPGSSVPELNNRHNDGARVALNLDLLQGLEGRYRFDWTNIDQTNTFDQLYRSDDPTLQSYVHRDRQTVASVNAPSLERSRTAGHSFTLSWYISENHTLRSITGYRKVKWIDYLDLDGSDQWVAHTKRITDYQQFSEDLHGLGHFGDLYYTLGLFYFRDDGFTNNPQTFENGTLNFDSEYGTQTHAWAGYGQLDWKLFEPLTLSAGVRYTRERKGLDRILGFSPVPGSIEDGCRTEPACAPPGTGMTYLIPAGFHVDGTFSATTPMFSLAWRPNKTLNFYLRYAEGFKSGGFNGEFSSLTPDPGPPPRTPQQFNEDETRTPFRPEKQKSLELGAKTSFFDGKALLNTALFYNKLEDLQVSIFTGGGAAASVIRNAGKATVYGAEVEGAWILFEGTQLRANYAYLHPKYDEFIDSVPNPNDPSGQTTVTKDESFNRAFVHAPRNSFNVVLDSSFLHTGFGTLRAVLDYAWTASFFTYPYQLAASGEDYNSNRQLAANTRVPEIGIFNARLALTAIPLGRTVFGEFALWGRNLANNAEPNNFIDFGPGLFQNLTVANFVEPRTFGLAAAVRW